MLVSQGEIRNHIEQIKLSYEGYRRQLDRLGLSDERRERLETDVRLLQEELAMLEKLAQFGRVEPNRLKIEQAVRERLEHLRTTMRNEPTQKGRNAAERDMASSEIRVLQWALGEDTLTLYSQELQKGHDPDPSRTDRAVPGILIHALEEGPDVETRASAAYELGKLRVAQAIPALVTALEDDPFIAGIALSALAGFTDDELTAAGLDKDVIRKVQAARK
ncbi:MAG: HEAT repeat domain-containing protein [Chloroflexota bacterium]